MVMNGYKLNKCIGVYCYVSYVVDKLSFEEIEEIVGNNVCLVFSSLNVILHIYRVKLKNDVKYMVYNNNEYEDSMALANLCDYIHDKYSSFTVDFNIKLGVFYR